MNRFRRNNDSSSVLAEASRRQNKRRSLPSSSTNTPLMVEVTSKRTLSFNDENSPNEFGFIKRARTSINSDDLSIKTERNTDNSIEYEKLGTSSKSLTPFRKISTRDTNVLQHAKNTQFKPHRISTSTPIASTKTSLSNLSDNLNNSIVSDFSKDDDLFNDNEIESSRDCFKTPKLSKKSFVSLAPRNNNSNTSVINELLDMTINSSNATDIKDLSFIECSTNENINVSETLPDKVTFQWASKKPVIISEEARKKAEKLIAELELGSIPVSEEININDSNLDLVPNENVLKTNDDDDNNNNGNDFELNDLDGEYFNSEDDALISSINESDLI